MLDAKPKQEIEKLVTGCIVGQIVIIVRGQFTEELANLGVKMAARGALDHLLFGLEKTSGAVQNMEVLSYRLVVFPVWVGCLWSNLAVLNGSKRTTPSLFSGSGGVFSFQGGCGAAMRTESRRDAVLRLSSSVSGLSNHRTRYTGFRSLLPVEVAPDRAVLFPVARPVARDGRRDLS